MLEKGYPKKSFAVKSYYCRLGSSPNRSFLWKSIWKVKVPPRVAFFSWTSVLGKILTIDALRKRGLIIADWCCMCKHNGESVDHLLLHCRLALEMWSMVFALFGVQWVMPHTVLDLFTGWYGFPGQNRCAVVWRIVPHCVIWCLWLEQKDRKSVV